MDYRGCICGVTGERFTYKIPVTVGCPYNKCAFCMLYKHLSYHELPMEAIEAEIVRVRDAGGKPKRIMLGDGSPLWMPFERLKGIITLIEQNLPSCEAICSDASIQAIATKTDEELTWLAQHGFRMVYVGIESGLDDVLAFMSKDHDNTEAREQIARLHAAGIDFGAHIMAGVAGAGRGIENARATAALLNELQPTYICDFCLFIGPVTQLGLMEEDGLFVRAGNVECMEEELELVRSLEPEGTMFFEGYLHTRQRKPGVGTKEDGALAAEDFDSKIAIAKGDLADECIRERIERTIANAIEDTRRFEAAYLEPAALESAPNIA